ncbi:MAG: hypothetical protein BMS9Abin36_0680 [Gammaproteobacteria bacterium]|nr:MAG: hypothetical protein BMS9Abin36_0680 [Gammaproteobacteria bacterium]
MAHYLIIFSTLVIAACQVERPPPPARELPAIERQAVTLDSSGQDKLLIPNEVLVIRGGIPGVFVLQDKQARFRMVRTGQQHDGSVQILAGLSGNETLLRGELSAVHDGSPVTIKP